MKKLTVALLYNLKQNAPHVESNDEPWDKWNELDSERTVAGIERALRAGGHEVIPMEGDVTLPQKLERRNVDIAFNTCEGFFGGSREAQVPALLDAMRMPYTGSGVMTLALALDKPMTKRILAYHGLPTPAFQTFVTGDEPLDKRLTFPLFVKPSREGSGIGVRAQSVVRNARELREQIRYVITAYAQPALVEEFIEGREFTLGMLGNFACDELTPRKGKWTSNTLRVFPPLEVDLSPCPPEEAGLYTSVIKGKLYEVPTYLCPAPISKTMRAKMQNLAMGAFAALECFDFARVDFRIHRATNVPYILEINPLAGLQEGISDIVMQAEADGVSYIALINGILEAAAQRYGLS
ncbi:MAG: ATP-grasp domain-containing protein [Chloroflexi bacterium]|nr:ATP-grasp domain-containing protein [Chloroflexota bacterium]